jgi:hypothetical protein
MSKIRNAAAGVAHYSATYGRVRSPDHIALWMWQELEQPTWQWWIDACKDLWGPNVPLAHIVLE